MTPELSAIQTLNAGIGAGDLTNAATTALRKHRKITVQLWSDNPF